MLDFAGPAQTSCFQFILYFAPVAFQNSKTLNCNSVCHVTIASAYHSQ